MGGGGGSADIGGNGYTSSDGSGGAGGAMVVLRASRVVGGGATINLNGAQGLFSRAIDGSGGAGSGGGCVLISNTAGFTFNANGGATAEDVRLVPNLSILKTVWVNRPVRVLGVGFQGQILRFLNHFRLRREVITEGIYSEMVSDEQARSFGYVRHQKLHLIGQYAAITQNKVFPQAWHVRRVQQRHVGLFRGSAALSMVAGAACSHHVHPGVDAFLRKRHDVLARQIFFVEVLPAIGAQIAVTGKQLAVG